MKVSLSLINDQNYDNLTVRNDPIIPLSYLQYFTSAPCTYVFDTTYPDAACVLYDDEYCDGEEGVKELRSGEFFMDSLEFDVESVSIRKGCRLNVYTGRFRLEIRLKYCI